MQTELNLTLNGKSIPKDLVKFLKNNGDRRILITVGYSRGGTLKVAKGEFLGLLDDVIYLFRRQGKGNILGLTLLKNSERLIYEDGIAVNISLKATSERVIRRVFDNFEDTLKFLKSKELRKILPGEEAHRVIFYIRWRGIGGRKHYMIGEPIGVIEKKKGGLLQMILIPIKLPVDIVKSLTKIIFKGKVSEIAKMAEQLLKVYKHEGVILMKVIRSDYNFETGRIYVGEKLRKDLPTAHIKPEITAIEIKPEQT